MMDLANEAANQYYILEIALLTLLNRDDIVQSLGTERGSLDGTKFVMKTNDGLVDVPELSEHNALSHEEVKEYLSNPANGFIEEEI